MEYDIYTGLGLQIIDISLTGSDSDLITSAKTFRFKIFHDDTEESETVIVNAAPLGSVIPTDKNSSHYEVDGVRWVRLVHRFQARGKFLIVMAVEDQDGDITVAAQPITVGVGDGLPEGVNINV